MSLLHLAKIAAVNNASEKSDASKSSLSLSNNPLSNFLRGDDKGLDWRYGMFGEILNPIAYAPSFYSDKVITPFLNNYKGANPGDVGYELANKLTDFAKTKGMSVNPINVPFSVELLNPQQAKHMRGVGGYSYNHINNSITHGDARNASIIAHEIGHGLPPRWMVNPVTAGLSNVSRGLGLGLGTLGALMSRDETNSRRSAIAGSLAQVPGLGIELDASIRGARLLKSLGAKSGIGAFIGLPTYALAAASPLGAHYTKKLLGGFENRKTASDNSILRLVKKAFVLNNQPANYQAYRPNNNYNNFKAMPQNNPNVANAQKPTNQFNLARTAKDFGVAAGLSTLGTTAGLGLAGLAAHAAGVPGVSKLFNNAAKESLLFFNPFRSFNLIKRLPKASELAMRQMALSDDALKYGPTSLAGKTYGGRNILQESNDLRNASQAFQAKYKESPADTLEKGIGVANGVMNLGVGGLVGIAPSFMPGSTDK